MTQAWWQLDIEAVLRLLTTNAAQGLTPDDAKKRLDRYGPNQLREKKGRSPLSIFLEQFGDFIVWVLVGAALVSGFLKEWVDAGAILAIVVLNAILGFIQEYRAEKSLAALKKLSSPTSKVIRNGRSAVIPSSNLVPGDLIELEAGDHIPADCRLCWITSNFAVQEASLTGESTPVTKNTAAIEKAEIPLGDRVNMVYMGTSVVAGKARAILVETGMSTELGKIASLVQEIRRETTPLQKKLEEFGKWIVYLCFLLVGMVFLLQWLRNERLIDAFLTAVSLAVAAIPEGLPAVVTISLALGVQRMIKRHVLIRKLPSVETLGCATVICSDKTGTLTKNEMTVQAVYADGSLFSVSGIGYEPRGEFVLKGKAIKPADIPGLNRTLACAVLCNGAQLTQSASSFTWCGDPTEVALLVAAGKALITKENLQKQFPFVEELPFDSERKRMTIIRSSGATPAAFVKGAPDVLLEDCTSIEENGQTRPLSSSDRERIIRVVNELSERAMRVLAVGFKDLSRHTGTYTIETVERDMTFVGLLAMIDPARHEVKLAMQQCRSAGIRTVMITGDHKNTAVAIARDLGMYGKDSLAITGEELDRLPEDKFREEVDKVAVYARVSPEHKLRIVKAWRDRGEVVAMTGDGVNDAPAVKEANIGVAMGITGTDVTKEVSDMVVTDDNFASIVAAVEEGRGIYSNINKFIHYLLSCNTGEILVMFVASLIGWPVPLLPVHILWVNLVTDGLPALALGMDPVDSDVMKRRPRNPREPVVTTTRALLMLLQGAFIAACTLTALSLVRLFETGASIERARTVAFIVLACSQLFHAFNCRNSKESLFRIGILSNPQLVLAALVSCLLQISVVYIPILQPIFKTEMLSAFDWLLVIVGSSFPLWAMEIVKLINRRTAWIL